MKDVIFDERRKIIIAEDSEQAVALAVEDWIQTAKQAILQKGSFNVALSGGSTPKAIYSGLVLRKNEIDWSKVRLFWSDERACSPTSKDSNYRMAMEAGFQSLVSEDHIFPMKGEGDLEANAREYEALIQTYVPEQAFDLVMLGMGDDGHTASLFPKTHGLHATGRNVIANFLPDRDIWRLSLTFDCINRSSKIVVYILGSSKAATLHEVFFHPGIPDILPIQNIGTEKNSALFILDKESAAETFNGKF